MPIDVAVLGSCVTRDLFNSKFIPNYKNFYQCVLTQNQTSIISLMSEPTTYAPNPEDGLSAYKEWNVRTDFSKEFLQLMKEKQPSYLILDFFADVHFGCVQLGPNQFITDNRWMVQQTSYYKTLMQQTESGGTATDGSQSEIETGSAAADNPAAGDNQVRKIDIRQNEAEYLELWKRSVDKLFAFLDAEVPNCQVIVHQARNVAEYLDAEGERRPLATSGKVQKLDPHYLNELWERLDSYVLQNYPVHSINVFHEDLISLEDHPWGAFYVHYTMDYYRDSMNELHRVVLDDRLSSERDNFYLSIVSDLGRADKKKTEVIKDREKTIEAFQAFQQQSRQNQSIKPNLKAVPRRVKRLVRRRVITPLRKVYEQI